MLRYLVIIALATLLAFDAFSQAKGNNPSDHTIVIEVDCLQLLQKGFSWVDLGLTKVSRIELVCTEPVKTKPNDGLMPRGLKVGLAFNKEMNK